jgi:hypothetical protein
MTDVEEDKSDYVKLISSDGFEFVIHREAAMRSGTIKNMLDGPGKLLRRTSLSPYAHSHNGSHTFCLCI